MKYLGYADQLALGQDADGNVAQWYSKGDDIPSIDPVVEAWLVASGFTFDPMPDAEASQQTLTAAYSEAETAPSTEAPPA